jgi:GTP-binding protein Era
MKAGFVALVGLPNVGKSTLLNQILGEKIAIATPKPQTTRTRLLGVHHDKQRNAQIAFVDTPGLHRPRGRGRTKLNAFMMHEALSALADVDAIVLLVDAEDKEANTPDRPGPKYALGEIEKANKPVVLALNKVDRVKQKTLLLPLLEAWQKAFSFASIVPISAKNGTNVDQLVGEIVALLPEGEALFDEDMLTDRAERWIAAEYIREQVFLLVKQEVPYAVAVTIDEWEERDRDVVVRATIHVEKEAQKRILVGAGGSMVKEIGTRARAEIARLVGRPAHLTLFVRVDEGWTEDERALRDMGYGDE